MVKLEPGWNFTWKRGNGNYDIRVLIVRSTAPHLNREEKAGGDVQHVRLPDQFVHLLVQKYEEK
jgi:hypothetical protein